MPVFNNILAGAAGSGGAGYKIERSLRFNSGDSPYLNRTPSSAGNRGKWTWSGWVKRSKLGAWSVIFSAAGSGSNDYLAFEPSDRLTFDLANTGSGRKLTTRVFRDCSAFYHIVLAVDYTSATANDRIKLYVNGVLETTFDTNTAPAQNHSGNVNNNTAHRISSVPTGIDFFNGYLADVHFIDGQQLAATDFGETDATTGAWNPIEYTGAYGGSFSVNYADHFVYSNVDGGTIANVFDGSTSTEFEFNSGGGTGRFTPPGGIAYTSSIEVYTARTTTMNVSLNGGSNVAYGNGWTTIASGSGTLTELAFTNGNAGNQRLGAIRVDGTILTTGTATGPNGFHLDFSDNSSNAALGTDSSGNSNTWTVNNLTAQSVTGPSTGSSWFFDGSSSLYANDSSLALGTGDWTVEYFLLPWNNYSAQSTHIGYNGNSPFFETDGATKVRWMGGSVYGSSLAYPNWYHIAYVSDGGQGAMWVNGTRIATNLTVGNNFTQTELRIGQRINETVGTRGRLSNVHIVVGTAKYKRSQATIPIPHTPIPVIADTKLLALSTNTLTEDASGNNITLTAPSSGITVSTPPDIGESVYQDSLLDSPTNYEASSGNNGGNYATLNPLQTGSGLTLSNGNLDLDGHSNWRSSYSTIFLPSDKWYAEFTIRQRNSSNSYGILVGLAGLGTNFIESEISGGDSYAVQNGPGNMKISHNGASTDLGSQGAYAVGDVLQLAYDADNGKLWFGKNGTYINSGNPSAGSNEIKSGINGTYCFAVSLLTTTDKISANFGQRPFAYTPPTGYKSLCTQNLTDPTIADGSTVFDIALWSGTGSSNAIAGLNTAPDFAWIKSRNSTGHHTLVDAVRGPTKALFSNRSVGEVTDAGYLSSFDSNGFTVVSDNDVNGSGYNYVAWAWDAGSSTVSNTDGSITSSVRANQSAGFSIVAYTGNGSSSATVGHGLNAQLGMLIHKRRDAAASWKIKHKSLATNHQLLFDTAASVDVTGNHGGGMGDLTSSSTFGFAQGLTNVDNVNGNNVSYINYCFAPVEGYSAFGSYTGNGSADGPFVALSFAPRWIMVKVSSTNNSWVIVDSERDSYNIVGQRLRADLSNAEDTQDAVDFLSNGFKVRSATASTWNDSGQTYIYAAFAEHPFKTARAR